jgi:hypothetical protein
MCGLAPLLRNASEAFLHELDGTTVGEIATPADAMRSARLLPLRRR